VSPLPARGGTIAAYIAFLMKGGLSVHDFSRFTEVHPSSDGVYSLMKYAADRLAKGDRKPRND